MSYLSPFMTLLINAVKKAASPLNRDFSEIEQLQSSVKSYKDFVVSAYGKVDRALRTELGRIKPDFPIAVDGQPKPKGSCFVVAPIDGLNNFAHGIPQFAISVAVFENGDRNGKLRNAVGKIIQTVNRRNDKTRAFRLGLSVNGNRKIGLNTSKFGTQGTIYFSVSRNDKILIAFDRRLKLFNLAEVPIERAGRLFDGINQQGHERGKVRHAILLSLHKWLRQCRQRFCHRC